MPKPCAWCGKTIGDDDRICPSCLSAQPKDGGMPSIAPVAPAGPAAPGAGVAPPAPHPAHWPPPGQRSSNTGRVVAIVIGASVAAFAAVAIVAIVAITFLGTESSTRFQPAGRETNTRSGRDYPADVRRAFMASCSVNGPQSACACALDRIEDEYTLDQFADLEQQIARSGQLPPTVQSIVAGCAAGG